MFTLFPVFLVASHSHPSYLHMQLPPFQISVFILHSLLLTKMSRLS